MESNKSTRNRPSPRDVAIHHATLLQHRKDLEAQILDSLILLSSYPPSPSSNSSSSPSSNSSSPAPAAAAAFKSHVRLFQPSDYDDLIEERNVNNLCGYALCPRPRKLTGPGGEWKLTSNGGIVKRKDLERWCSPQCARRALYVKVQLCETAAWERAGIPDIRIDLLDEDGEGKGKTEEDREARRVGEERLRERRQQVRDSAALAAERGDAAGSADRGVSVTVRERDVKPMEMSATGLDERPDNHLFIDGFKARLPERTKPPAT